MFPQLFCQLVIFTLTSECKVLEIMTKIHIYTVNKETMNHSLSGDDGPRAVVNPNRAIFFFLCPGSAMVSFREKVEYVIRQETQLRQQAILPL